MKTLEEIVDSVNYQLKKTAYFYISRDIERGLGLEEILSNYFLIASEDSFIVDYLNKIEPQAFSLSASRQAHLTYSAAKLLQALEVKEFINSHSKQKDHVFQTFKTSTQFEIVANEYDAKVFNSTAYSNRQFENKISQFENLSEIGVRFPKTLIAKLEDVTYESLTKFLGARFVMQFNRGHTGKSTYFPKNVSELESFRQKFPKRQTRFSELVDGVPYTINACATKFGIFAGGLSYQITGQKGLVGMQGATVGNDFSFHSETLDKFKSDLYEQIQKIGKFMYKHGFKGLFGIDFLVNEFGLYIIEVNARQPASISFYTKLQLMRGSVPLSLLHIAEFSEFDDEKLSIDIDPREYFDLETSPIQASQVFMRNKGNENIAVTSDIKAGEYVQDDTLNFIGPAYSIDQINKNNFLLLSSKSGKIVRPSEELGRIQLLQAGVGSNGEVKPWIIDTLQKLEIF